MHRKNLEEILKKWGGQRKGKAGNNQIEIRMSTIQNENGGGVASFWMFVKYADLYENNKTNG